MNPKKTRPVVTVQTELLNELHPSTLICPVTSKVNQAVQLLCFHLKKTQLDKASDVWVDQIRAIDNTRLKKNWQLDKGSNPDIKKNIRIVMNI